MDGTFKNVISSTLPFLGSLVGGPFGAQAGSIISNIITGKPNSSEDDIKKSLLSCDADKIIELKKLDQEYQSKLLDFQVNQQKLDLDDVSNARKTSIDSMNSLGTNAHIIEMFLSRMPAVLASFLTCGFFTVLLIFMLYPVQSGARDVMEVLIGTLGTCWLQSMSFFFGTTHGSQTKTKFLLDKRNGST